MKSFLLSWGAFACVLMGLFASIWGAQAQGGLAGQELGGFTPNPEITLAILGTTHAPGSTVEAIVTITGPSVGTYQVTFTNQDTEEEMAAPLELTIGGEPEANSGSAQIVLPDAPGQVTIVASFALNEDDEPVTDSETLTLAVAGTTPGGGTTPPGDGGTDTPPGDGDTTPGGGGTTTPPDGDDDGDTPPAPLPISLTATAISPSKVNLSWSGAATKLYRSTQANFTPGTNTLIAENEASVTTHTDTGLTPQTTYHYILVPNGNPDLTQGSASATTPALTAITLTATAEDATTIELSWSGAAGTLYSSTEPDFTADEETRIPRGEAENDAAVTSYTHEGLTPETTYYYILVPNGTPDLTQGEANAATPDLERSAQASFLLLKSNGEEAGDTIGGTVTVVLELELENAETGSENAVVRIQETGTEGEVTHDEDEDHIDFSLDLTQAAGWQQWLDPDDEGPQEASWQSATSAPVGTGKWRWSQTWNTAGAPIPEVVAPGQSQLLNHNGAHTISLAQVDGGEGGTLEFGEESADVEDKDVTVGNLVISGVTSDEYFLLGQDLTNSNDISFTVEDNDLSDEVEVNVTIWPTNREGNAVTQIARTLTQTFSEQGTSRSVTVTWDGLVNGVDESNQAALVSAPEGAYTYDIQVTQTADGDSSSYRSSTLGVSSSALTIVDPAEDSTESPVDNQAHVAYSLSETPLSGSIRINYHYGVDDDSPQEQGPFSDQTRSESNPVSFEYGGDPSAYTVLTVFVIRAKDNHAAQHRDHQSKPMLPKNRVAAEKKKVFYHAYMLSGSTQANSSTYIERSQLWQTSSNAPPKMLHVWQNSDLHGGNSGGGARMNSIRSSDQWSGFGEGGPTPEYDEVAENRSVQSESPLWLPYRILDQQLSLKLGMQFEYKGEMRGWRWQISGRNLGDDGDWDVQTRYNVGGPGNQRQWLRIHIDLEPGTDGCLGIHDINSYVKLNRRIHRLLKGNGVIAETGFSRVPLYVVEGGLFGGARPAAESNVGAHHPPHTKYSAYKIDGSGNVVKGQ